MNKYIVTLGIIISTFVTSANAYEFTDEQKEKINEILNESYFTVYTEDGKCDKTKFDASETAKALKDEGFEFYGCRAELNKNFKNIKDDYQDFVFDEITKLKSKPSLKSIMDGFPIVTKNEINNEGNYNLYTYLNSDFLVYFSISKNDEGAYLISMTVWKYDSVSNGMTKTDLNYISKYLDSILADGSSIYGIEKSHDTWVDRGTTLYESSAIKFYVKENDSGTLFEPSVYAFHDFNVKTSLGKPNSYRYEMSELDKLLSKANYENTYEKDESNTENIYNKIETVFEKNTKWGSFTMEYITEGTFFGYDLSKKTTKKNIVSEISKIRKYANSKFGLTFDGKINAGFGVRKGNISDIASTSDIPYELVSKYENEMFYSVFFNQTFDGKSITYNNSLSNPRLNVIFDGKGNVRFWEVVEPVVLKKKNVKNYKKLTKEQIISAIEAGSFDEEFGIKNPFSGKTMNGKVTKTLVLGRDDVFVEGISFRTDGVYEDENKGMFLYEQIIPMVVNEEDYKRIDFKLKNR